MNCPDCGGPMWDNREKKASGQYKENRSDYSCKNKEGCGKGVWLKPGNGASAGRGAAGSNGHAGNGASRPTSPLAPVYAECMEIASRAVKHFVGDKATPADIIAATATLFIGATNTGRPVKKAVAVAPKAPPPPPPEPEEEEYEEASDLPF